VQFFQGSVDAKADTFFIDPDDNNPRAKHVYAKAGFDLVGDFVMKGGVFDGKKTDFMVKKLPPKQ
jgi:RimJ/RimL family protein N-acetyltransferase